MALLWLVVAMIGGADSDPECLVLGGLDATRTRAFLVADPELLRDVYVNAAVASTDVDVLREYRERGLRLEGMHMVREWCRVTDRSRRRLSLDVVDRLGPTSVRTADGHRTDLPRDRPTRRTVVLERTGQAWRVASVRTS